VFESLLIDKVKPAGTFEAVYFVPEKAPLAPVKVSLVKVKIEVFEMVPKLAKLSLYVVADQAIETGSLKLTIKSDLVALVTPAAAPEVNAVSPNTMVKLAMSLALA